MDEHNYGLPDDYSFVLDGDRPPVKHVRQGEKFSVETKDAVDGKITDENTFFTAEKLEPMSLYSPELANPVYGPVFVEGVQKGDLLSIEILDIRTPSTGLTGIKPGQGLLHDSKSWPEINGYPCTKILEIDQKLNQVRFSRNARWSIAPFIGTIGVAPEVEVHASSIVQGPFGGNWDCRHICKGSKLFLNAQVEGGLLYIGDVHGSQGDGELSGIANEIEAEVDLAVQVVSHKTIPYARIETETHLVCIYSAKPLETAVAKAVEFLLVWLGEVTSVPVRDIYMIFSTCPEFRIEVYQMVDMPGILYTAGATMLKGILG